MGLHPAQGTESNLAQLTLQITDIVPTHGQVVGQIAGAKTVFRGSSPQDVCQFVLNSDRILANLLYIKRYPPEDGVT
ncbi:hypothetical protein SCT_3251 [Sulfuricella sp. T08]|nr:hypothetical protein SCT_3251 [Sulfuricella sp. T08]